MAYGADALWYPVGFVAGYFVLLLFVAAPLRRSGAYTVPDFAEVRLGSQRPAPAVRAGRRRHRPALPRPAAARRRPGAARDDRRAGAGRRRPGRGRRDRQRRRRRHAQRDLRAGVPVLAQAHRAGRARVFLLLAWQADGRPRAGRADRPRSSPSAPRCRSTTTCASSSRRRSTCVVDGRPRTLEPGAQDAARGQHRRLPGRLGRAARRGARAGDRARRGRARCPAPAGSSTRCTRRTRWCSRRSSGRWGCRTCWCASTPTPTAGRPGARRSAVLALLGVFYLLPALYGALGRLYVPELLLTGRTDAVVLALPVAALAGAGRAAAAGAARRRRVRGVPVDVVRAARHDGGRARAGPAASRPRGGARPARVGAAASSSPPPATGAAALAARPARRRRCRSPRSSGWPSRSPRRRSARCSCSASGGAA